MRIPDDTTHPGSENRRIDNRLLGQVVGTAMDGCTSCQGPLLTLLAEDAATTAHVVELACIAVHQTYDGLPASMTTDIPPPTPSRYFATRSLFRRNPRDPALIAKWISYQLGAVSWCHQLSSTA
ncbi:hypothetical protein [Streptomyces sp. H34-S4]|uniref:hypothetical protein n=1 Tax=Streptomyces sp. H34-S4 TaxID=2996463 RepID=UPI00227142F1|nr:hypothetical protein [Streptomyces sp. H34-S4]MCY0939717.1 hypothetical protein [Streptomyces sp. H34-S4]